MATHLPDLLTFARANGPDRQAVICAERALTFDEVDRRADRLAAWLAAHGIGRGERVALLAKNVPEYLEIQVAAIRAGAILVPLNFRLAEPELAYIAGDCTPRLIIAAAEFADTAARLPAAHHLVLGDGYEAALASAGDAPARPADPEAPCTILYTSGTTGRPKGAVLTNAALHARINANLFEYRVRPGDRFLQCLPLFHIASNVSYSYLYAGASNVLLQDFDPGTVLELITNQRISTALLVPTMINTLVNHPAAAESDLSSLRLLAYGASPIAPSLLTRAIEVFGCDFLQLFGMTETNACTVLRPEDHDPVGAPERLASAGTAALGMEVRIVDDHDADVAPGAVGEVICRGPAVMTGYWANEAASAEALRGGWMHTGDMGRRDEDGYLYVTDRKKDMIVSGGENVYPREVEDVLFTHPDVLDAAVIGVPDTRWGERVHALVVPRPGKSIDERDLIAYARSRLAGYKLPKTVETLAELPRNATGKVLKNVLRAQRGGAAPGT